MNLIPSSIRVKGLSDSEHATLDALLAVFQSKVTRNDLRSRYYDSRQTVQHLGIAIPPQLESIDTVIGWPQKAVDDLEQRIDLEGFILPTTSWTDFGLDLIWQQNRLALEASQAHTSALKYAVAFAAVTPGITGGPDVLVRCLSATSSAALWDHNRRRISAAFSALTFDNGVMAEFIMFTEDAWITCESRNGVWVADVLPHGLGRAPVVALPFKPSLERPFGKSRLSRAVMSITDRAVRSLLRMEVSAEFYSAPQRYVLGASEQSFVDASGRPRTGWEVTIGKLLALDLNDAEQNPEVGQFPQMTMQPHMDMVRSDAAIFAGETGIPVNSLGIIHDNPASEAAMQTAYLPLVKTAERASTAFGLGWVEVMQLAYMVREGTAEVPRELQGMRAKFRDPATSTRTEMANATTMFVNAFPWAVDSDVTLEMFGLDQVDIDRLVVERRRAGASSRIAQLVAAARSPEVTGSGDGDADRGVPGGE